MDAAGTAIDAAVIAGVGLILAWFGRGRFEAVRQEIGARFDAVDQRFDSVREEFVARFDSSDRRIDRLEERLDRRLDAMQVSIDAMRSDVTQVALAVGVRPRATNA